MLFWSQLQGPGLSAALGLGTKCLLPSSGPVFRVFLSLGWGLEPRRLGSVWELQIRDFLGSGSLTFKQMFGPLALAIFLPLLPRCTLSLRCRGHVVNVLTGDWGLPTVVLCIIVLF